MGLATYVLRRSFFVEFEDMQFISIQLKIAGGLCLLPSNQLGASRLVLLLGGLVDLFGFVFPLPNLQWGFINLASG